MTEKDKAIYSLTAFTTIMIIVAFLFGRHAFPDVEEGEQTSVVQCIEEAIKAAIAIIK